MIVQRNALVSVVLGIVVIVIGWVNFSGHITEIQSRFVSVTMLTPAATFVIPGVAEKMEYSELSLKESSLMGTTPPDSLRIENGVLVVDEGFRDVVDYFLSLDEEVSEEAIFQLLENHIQQMAPRTNVEFVMAVAQRYFSYLQSPGNQFIDTSQPMQQQLDQFKELRRELLGADIAEQFYAAEESYMEYSIQKMHIVQDADLDTEERQQQLAQLHATLPEELDRWRVQDQSVRSLRKWDAELKLQGASENEIDAKREMLVGKEASSRLRDLDNRREQWTRRYADYQTEAEGLVYSGLSSEDKDQELMRVRDRHFDATETIRVAALDRMVGGN